MRPPCTMAEPEQAEPQQGEEEYYEDEGEYYEDEEAGLLAASGGQPAEKELTEMKLKLAEMEEEAKKLQEMQAKVEGITESAINKEEARPLCRPFSAEAVVKRAFASQCNAARVFLVFRGPHPVPPRCPPSLPFPFSLSFPVHIVVLLSTPSPSPSSRGIIFFLVFSLFPWRYPRALVLTNSSRLTVAQSSLEMWTSARNLPSFNRTSLLVARFSVSPSSVPLLLFDMPPLLSILEYETLM